EFQLTILGESQEQGFEQYEISVHLSEDCLLKGARVYMIFELLEKMGEVVQTDPAVQDLEEEKFDNSFKILYISKTSMEEIQQKLMKVSEVASIEVVPFVLDAYKNKLKQKILLRLLRRMPHLKKNKKQNNLMIMLLNKLKTHQLKQYV